MAPPIRNLGQHSYIQYSAQAAARRPGKGSVTGYRSLTGHRSASERGTQSENVLPRLTE